MNKCSTVYWFRQDLRLVDNAALTHALEMEDLILPLYIYETGTSRPWGATSKWWLHHSLKSLKNDLGSLCLKRGNPVQILTDLVENTGLKHIVWAKRYDPFGQQTDAQVKAHLTTLGVTCHEMPSGLLHEPGETLNQSGKPFQVFTPYWRACRSRLNLKAPLARPDNLTLSLPPSDRLEDWKLLPSKPDWAESFHHMWKPGEIGAQERLNQFINHGLKGYGTRRNIPSDSGTSGLSPHLHWGEMSPRYIFHAIQNACLHNPDLSSDAEVFLSELGWREFSYDCLARFPELKDKSLRLAFEQFPWQENSSHLEAWQCGKTGYPIVDAGMRQLWKMGWMHNRVRMIVASFLTKHLLIPWQKGEQWFWDTLVDADEASNAMGWQWVAGCGVDAAPYFRIFNPVLQGEKFDPQGHYVRQWIPELKGLPDAYIHQPWKAPPMILGASGITLGKNYPHPIVDHATGRDRALQAYKQMNDS